MISLPFFPTPYPDEALYSIIARYHKLSGNLDYYKTMHDLFVKNIGDKDFLMPGHMRNFYNRLPEINLTIDELINNHTLFPYYAAYKEGSRDTIKKQMIYGSTHKVKTLSGISTPVSLYNIWQLCPECVKNDKALYGENYWHRSHQLPGVIVCPIHNISLHKTKKLNEAGFIYPDLLPSDAPPAISKNLDKEMLFTFAKESMQLLHLSNFSKYNGSVDKYRHMLDEKGYFSYGRIKRRKLKQDFEKFYTVSFLEHLNLPIKESKRWIETFFKKNAARPVVKHILMTIFFLNGVQEFEKLKIEKIEGEKTNSNQINPFGDGPWPCLNPAHQDYCKKVIKNVELKEDKLRGRIVGYFKCDCGFIYTRYGNDEYKKSVTTQFGPIWENKLKSLVENGENLSKIAKELNVGNGTAKRQKNLLHLNLLGGKAKEKIFFEKRNYKRKKWLELIKVNNLESASTENKPLYDWLKENDNLWLQKHSQKKTGNKNVVDWEKRDVEIYQEIKDIVDNWSYFEKERYKRITKRHISNLLMNRYKNILSSNEYNDKIPISINYLESVVETSEQFQVRKNSSVL